MSESVVNNKLIVKNTIFLYVRMVVVMLISLYTVRAFLSILGEVDFGLYNVIGGVVGMFSFINGTLATSSQKFFSQSLVSGDIKSVNKVFCLNLSVYFIFAIIVVIILETVGLWFVNTQMTIPSERMFAANVVYQISIFTFVMQLMVVSYNALIIAYERMRVFAFIGIFEAVMKLGFVFVLLKVSCDKLITYAFLYLFLYIIIALIYITYCHNNFEESKYHYYWNKYDACKMLSFSGWHLLGTLSVILRGQGVNILINMFFSPAVNAARTVSYQVEGAIIQLSNSFFTAVKPQMYKSYSNGELIALNNLVLRSSTICFFLVSVLSVPFLCNAKCILGLWLTDVPEYTIAFTQLVLIEGLIDSVSGSAICPALATGNIKRFYLVTGNLVILTLPIAYIYLKLGYLPTTTMWISIIISLIALAARAFLLVRLIQLPIKRYFALITKLIVSSIIIGFITYYEVSLFDNMLMAFVVSTIVSTLLHCGIYYIFICNKAERIALSTYINSRFVKSTRR